MWIIIVWLHLFFCSVLYLIGASCYRRWVDNSKDPLIKHYNEEIDKHLSELGFLFEYRKIRVKEILFNKDFSATAEGIKKHKTNLKNKEKENGKEE